MLERSSAVVARPERHLVSALTEVPLPVRSAMLDGPYDAESHRQHCANLPCLHQVEVGGEAVRGEADEIRIAVRNVERLRSATLAAELLLPNRPDVALLSEVDKGMVRSGNGHWNACNLMIPTERPQPGRAERPRGKIDWIFSRGLRVTRPAVVPAVDASGVQISDHDCLFVTIGG